MADVTAAAEAMKAVSSALKSNLAKQGLDGAGTAQSASEGAQNIVECLPLKKMGQLPQLFSNLTGALQRAATNPASLVQRDSCFAGCVSKQAQKLADAKISALQQECHKLSAALYQAHTQIENTALAVEQGITKLSSSASEKVSALQGLPKEFTRLADLVTAYKFSDINLTQLEETADVKDVQESISQVRNLLCQVKESAGHVMNEVLKDVLDFVGGAPQRLMDAGMGGLACHCVGGLLPRPKISESTKAMLNQLKEIAELASHAYEGMKGYAGQSPAPDGLDAADTKLRDFSASLGAFSDSVNRQVEKLRPVVESAKGISGVGRLLNPVLAEGKKARGADVTDKYKFGDLSRGLVKEVQKHMAGEKK